MEYPLSGGVCLRISSLIAGKRHLAGLAIITVMTLVALGFGVKTGLGTHDVKVSAWDREISITTRAATVADVLAAVNISLSPGDLVQPSLDTAVEDGMEIKVERARPVFVKFRQGFSGFHGREAGIANPIYGGIEPEPDDVVYPGLDEELSQDPTIRVAKVTYGEVTEEQEIAYDTQKREDGSLEVGLTRMFKNGTTGLLQVIYQVKYEDGVKSCVKRSPGPL